MIKWMKVAVLLLLLFSAQVVQADTRVYELYRNTVNDPTTATLITNISATSYTDVPPSTDMDYYYWVKVRTTESIYGDRRNLFDDTKEVQVLLKCPTTATVGVPSKIEVTAGFVFSKFGYPAGIGGNITLEVLEDDPGVVDPGLEDESIGKWTYSDWFYDTPWLKTEVVYVDLSDSAYTGWLDGDAEVYAVAQHSEIGVCALAGVINVQILDTVESAPENFTASAPNTSGVVLSWSSATGNSDFSNMVIGRRLPPDDTPPPPPPGSQTIVRTATDDTFVNEAAPTTTNGLWQSVVIKNKSTDCYGLLNFSLSSIPDGSTVNSAKLQLYFEYVEGSNPQLFIQKCNASWSESSATWNNKPQLESSAFAFQTPSVGWVNIQDSEFLAMVQGWVDGSNYGLAVRVNPNEHEYGFKSTETSSGSAYYPTLEVTYTPPSSYKISGYVTSGGNGINGVTISANNSGGSTTTDGNGYYELTVPNGWSGIVTLSKSGFSFSPSSKSYNSITSDDSNESYTGSDIIPPGSVSGFNATPGDAQVRLTWSNPSDSDFSGVKVMRKTGGYPANKDDGTEVYNDSGTGKTDTGLVNNTKYYYKAFAYDTSGNYASGRYANATPDSPPVVSNVRVQQRAGTKLVDIYYDVEDADDSTASISVSVMDNGGTISASSFSGDVGTSVSCGADRHIVWNAGADWSGQVSSALRIGIDALGNENGPIVYYPFDGDANDASGNGRNATLYNTASYVSGVHGQAVYLQGRGHIGTDGDYVMFPFVGMNNFPSFTVSLWVKHDGYAGVSDHGEDYISFRKPGGSTMRIGFGGSPWQFGYGTSGSTVVVPSDGSEWGNWVLHTMVVSNGNVYAYKNGVLRGSASGAYVDAESEGGLGTHWFSQGVSTRFIGAIDDVRIYNQALSGNDVWSMFSSGTLEFSSPIWSATSAVDTRDYTLILQGSSRLTAHSTNLYSCIAQYSDGSSSSVTEQTVWSLVGSGASLNSNALSVGDITFDSTVTVQAVYGGVTNTLPVLLEVMPYKVLAAWDFFGTPSPSPATATAAVYSVDSAPVLKRTGLNLSGSTNQFIAASFPTNRALAEAVSANKYFEFSLSNTAPANVDAVSMCLRRFTSGSPTNFTLRVSADAGFSTYTDQYFAVDTVGYHVRSVSNLNVSGETVYFRLYGYGATNIGAAGFAGTTNSGTSAANSGLDGTPYDLIVYGSIGALSVTPGSKMAFTYSPEGVVSPVEQIFSISNAAGSSLDWTVEHSQPWVTLTSSGGTLGWSGSSAVGVSINSAAGELPAGIYTDTLVFRNSFNSLVQTRTVELNVVKATNIVIEGSAAIFPYSANQYVCRMQYSDGTDSDVTDQAVWSLIGDAHGAVLNGHALSVDGITSNETVIIQAVYNGFTNTFSVSLKTILPGVLAAWDFYGTPSPSPATATAAVYAVSSVPVLKKVGLGTGGQTNQFFAAGFPTNSALVDAVKENKYFEFVLSSTAQVTVDAVSMCLKRIKSTGSPSNFTLRVSSDADFSTYAEQNFMGVTSINETCLADNLNVSGSSVYFRIYGYGATNSYSAGFAGTTNSGPGAANSGLDGTLYDLIVYGYGSLAVTPVSNTSFTKISTNPVTPEYQLYSISNTAASSLDWTLTHTQDWVTVTSDGGTLASENTVDVGVSINSAADELPTGIYTDTLVIRSSGDSMVQLRAVELRVVKITNLIVEGSTRLPANSTNFYACRAQYSDGTMSNVTGQTVWSLLGSGATMKGNVLSVGDITADSTGTIQAAYGGLSNMYSVTLKFIPPGLIYLGALFTNVTADLEAVVYTNGYAYAACGYAGLIVFDVSNPTNPVRVGGYDTDGQALGITVRSNLVFIADGGADLQILDVAVPSNPVPVGQWQSDYDLSFARKVSVSGQYAYLAAGSRGLLVLDISNISVPRLVAEYGTDNAWGVTTTGQYAYVADYTNGLKIIDISTPTNPVFAGFYPIDGSARDVAVRDGYAYVVAYTNGLQVINVSSPTNPVYVAGYVTNYCSGIVLEGDFAYMANGSSGLGIVNISNPSAPISTGRFDDNSGSANGVFIANGNAFVANGYGGIQIVNISSLSLLGSYDTRRYAYDVAVKGSYAYLAGYLDGLITVDISNPDAPVVVATNTWTTSSNAYGLDISGDYLYVVASGLRLVVYDISNPASPALVSTYNFNSTSGTGSDVAIYSNYAYCVNSYAGSTNTLAVIDVSTPSNLVYVSDYNTGGAAYGVDVQDQYAYLASGTNGLQIFDVSNPSNIVWTGSYIRPPVNEFESQPSSVRGIAVSGNYAYMLGSGVTLAIVDVSDRRVPKLAGMCDLGRSGADSEIFVQYPYVFIAYDTGFQMPKRNGLWIIDVSDSASPVIVADYPTGGYSRGVTVNNGHVYLADDPKGLHTFTWGAAPKPGRSVTNFVVYRFPGGNSVTALSAKTTNSYEGYVQYSDRSIQSVSTSAVWTVIGEWYGAVFNENHLTADGVTSNGAVITVQGSYGGFSDTLDVTLYYDRNTNGIPDWWELQYSGGITGLNPDALCANGFNTLREAYIAGLNPNDPSARFGITGDARSKTLQWNSVSGRTYNIYWTTNLINGFQPLETNIPWTRVSFTNSTNVPCGYYKIDVKLVP